MRRAALLLLFSFVCVRPVLAKMDQTVWSIGIFDKSSLEFSNHPKGSVTFRIGQSDRRARMAGSSKYESALQDSLSSEINVRPVYAQDFDRSVSTAHSALS